MTDVTQDMIIEARRNLIDAVNEENLDKIDDAAIELAKLIFMHEHL